MGEDEGGAGDVADFAGAGGDVLEGAPALVEQGEPSFAQAAQRALDGVAGAGADIEIPPICGLYHRSMTWPFTLTAGSLHRSAGMIFPSKITWENPSPWARSSAWRRSGACSASTSITSSTYR